MSDFFPAKVIKILDHGNRVIINRGAIHDIRVGQRFLVYGVEDELQDPDTGESLGALEIVRGTGKAIHVQDKITTIESDKKITERTIKKFKNSGWRSFTEADEEETLTPTDVPFDNPETGDLVKPL